MIKREIIVDLCFVRPKLGGLAEEVEKELLALFGNHVDWYLNSRDRKDFEIVAAKVCAANMWKTIEEAAAFIEENAGFAIWDWLRAYKMKIQEGCGYNAYA